MTAFQTRDWASRKRSEPSALVLSPSCPAKPVAQLFVQRAVEVDMPEPLFVMLMGPACAKLYSTRRAELAKHEARSVTMFRIKERVSEMF
jgi:hypothetical protein